MIILTLGIIFSYVFFLTLMDEGQPENLPIGVVDMDGSYLSRRLCHELDATQGISIKAVYSSHREAREAMQRQEIYAFVEIPHGTYADLLDFKTPHLSMYINNAYLLAGSLSWKTLLTMSNLASGAVQREILRKQGFDEERIMGLIQPIVVDTHQIGNPMANYPAYLLTTILPGILALLVLLMSIYAVGVELKDQTSREWIAACQGDVTAAVLGKLTPYTLWFSFLAIVGNIVLFVFFRFPIEGPFWVLQLAIVGVVVAMQAIGVFLVGVLPVMRDAISIGAFYGILGFSLSGFTYPVTHMGPALQALCNFFPLRHYYMIYVHSAMFNNTLSLYWPHVCAMVAFLLLPAITHRRLSRAYNLMNYPLK
ncbi:MAG: ABC transporter permease [Bacteroidales bacterium]|nr:ABC transporter permease [Bacteroidales bacterium]